ncbi:MAG: hypothetical protein A2X49_08060 [Lentisphaerae bacterium GWF2_52_8]|nr:MAG: hypothetical protein A2X49_08060 [Lentisphaerae bacterium GWF2_52_8]
MKICLPIISLLLISCLANAQNSAVLGDKFAQGKLENYLENAKSLKESQAFFEPVKNAKENCLVLNKDTIAVFKPIPIKEDLKYKLSFMVRAETKETIEENPRLALILLGRGSWLPCRDITFFDAEMKPLGRRSHYDGCLPFGTWFNFIDVFYPLPKAAFMQLSFQTRKDSKLFIRDISLSPSPDEGSINTNPSFSLGKYNYSGWPSKHTDGRLLERPDGRVIFDTGYGSGSESFPISPGKHRLYAKGSTYGGYQEIIFFFMDNNGKEISKTGMNSTPEGIQKEFMVPDGAVRGRFLIYNNVLDELRLTRVGENPK